MQRLTCSDVNFGCLNVSVKKELTDEPMRSERCAGVAVTSKLYIPSRLCSGDTGALLESAASSEINTAYE